MQAQVQLPTSVSNAGNYFQREDRLFPGIVQIPDHGAANAALGGIKPAPEKHEGTRTGPVRPALLRRA